MKSRQSAAVLWACLAVLCNFLFPVQVFAFQQPSKKNAVAPAKSTAAKPGKVAGLVVNVATGDPMSQAVIEVVATGQTTTSDTDGNFTLTLEAGTHELKITKSGFLDQKKEVTVVSGDVIPVDFALAQQGQGEIVEVNASGSGNEIALLEERKSGNTVAELIGRQEIEKSNAGDVAAVAQQLPGLSVVDNKFVYVRGLGDRYSNTVMNDSVMPTPQPERRVVPLDQVPSSLVQNVRILKTFTPDQPGEFAGGLVKIETLEFPNKSSLSFSTGLSGNTETTNQSFATYAGDRLDWLGFGLGRRGLPATVPADRQLIRGSSLIPGLTATELQNIGRSFENVWSPVKDKGPLNSNFSLSGSSQIGKLGLVASVTYGHGAQNLDEIQNYFRVSADSGGNKIVTAANRYRYNSGTTNARLGTLANAAYRLNPNNKLLFKTFFSNDAVKEARTATGFYDDVSTDILNRRLRYTLTRTSTWQLAGDHLISQLGDTVLAWRLTYSRATLNDPDLRESLYLFDQTQRKYVYFDTGQSGFRMFNEMRENIREPAFDLSKFYFKGAYTLNLKGGFSYINRDRFFNARRFRFAVRGLNGIDNSQRPEDFFAPQNIRPDGLEITEVTRNTDYYTASQNLHAGYAMADLTFKKMRVIGGVRFEHSKQDVRTFELFAANPKPVTANLENTDTLPSVGVVYSLKPEMALRFGYSRTVNRPQFRELSPFEFTDLTGGRSTLGNPNLKRGLLDNFDVRYEWFQKNGGLISVSFFTKNIKNPIETVVEPTSVLRSSYRNVDGATNRGLEFETRQNLGRYWGTLTGLTANANYTYVNSNVEIGDADFQVLTTKKRPLYGQSNHVVNVNLEYDWTKLRALGRLAYNYTGARISDVGSLGIPDTYEKGYPNLDFLFQKKFGSEKHPWELKFSADNLLNRLVRFKIEDQPFRAFRRGRTFSIGVSYTIL
ncbi:MAG: TonB-dependent receptor [Blastocatellia bacterium]|nr:TonB-dependent receptor [Blastocatellia bacterium]